MISNLQKEQIAHLVIQVLYSRFTNFPEDSSNNRNAPFHEAFLKAFSSKLKVIETDVPYFISLGSWLHGLSTSLGQTFFEGVAHTLSGGEKRVFTAKKKTQLTWTTRQQGMVTQIIEDLKNSNSKPDIKREKQLLLDTKDEGITKDAISFTADVFIQTNNKIVAVELKSVKPNAGEVRGEKQKILEAKAALIHKYRNYDVEFLFGFPFDPTSDTSITYDKERFLNNIIDGKKYLDRDEILLSSELWDFLSQEHNTMSLILEIINSIASPNFIDEFNFLNDYDMRSSERKHFMELAQKWFLFSEINLLNDELLMKQKLENGSRQQKSYYYGELFDTRGKYKIKRLQSLQDLLRE